MAQGYVQLPDDSSNTGKKEDHFITATAAQYREAVVVADPSTDAAVVKVTNAAPGQADYGLVVRDPILGAQADDKSAATNTTPISAVSIWKQISASAQAIATSIAGTLTVATHAVTQSGTWTVQPGNTANTTAWKVDGSAVTQPVSIATAPVLVAGTALIGKVGIDQTTPGATNAVAVTTNTQLSAIISPGLSAQATFTPAASSHPANNCNGAAGTFALSAVSGSRVMITDVSLEIDGNAAEVTAWRLYLYNVTPPSATADANAWDLVSGDRASFLGYIDLGTAIDLGSTQWVQQPGVNRSLKLAGTSVFAYLVNLTTLTPANVAHIVTLQAMQL